MRHLKSGRKLSRRKDHRKALLSNLAVSLINNDRIKTTDAKAKEVRPFIERMVTFARRGDLHARRIVLSRLKNNLAVKKLFEEIGPRYMNRLGGYTRIIKLGFRHGDNSPISLIEFVTDEEIKKTQKKKKTDPGKVKATKKTIETAETVEEKPEDTTEPVAEETHEAIEKTSEESITEEVSAPVEKAAVSVEEETAAVETESSQADSAEDVHAETDAGEKASEGKEESEEENKE